MNETYKNIDLFQTDDKNEVKPAVAAAPVVSLYKIICNNLRFFTTLIS